MVMGEGTPQQVVVNLDAGSDSRFVTLCRYADYEGLTIEFDRTPQGTRITVDDPDKGRASGLRGARPHPLDRRTRPSQPPCVCSDTSTGGRPPHRLVSIAVEDDLSRSASQHFS